MGAALAGKPDIDTVTAARMVRPYAWLLDRVGDEGIRLTGAGYLPPAHVEAAATELGLLEDWMGKGNRETQTLPVLHLRETATKMGLLRKHRGMLQLTAAGRKLRTDPVSLWWHLAERMPPRSAVISSPLWGVSDVALRAFELRSGRVILSGVHDVPEAMSLT